MFATFAPPSLNSTTTNRHTIMTTINDQPQHLLARYADRTGCNIERQNSAGEWRESLFPWENPTWFVNKGFKIRLALSEYGLPSHLQPYKDNPRLPGNGYRVPVMGDIWENGLEFYPSSTDQWTDSSKDPNFKFKESGYYRYDYRLPASVLPPDWEEMTREDAPADAPAKLPRPGQPKDDVQALKARVQELEGDYQMMQGSLLSILGELDCEEPASALLKLKEMKGERDAWMRTAKTRKHHLDHLEAQLAAASTPTLRPIAEMPAEVPEGCVRVFGCRTHNGWYFSEQAHGQLVTHFLDIRLPAPPDPDEELRREFEAWAKETFGWHPDKFTLKVSSGDYLDDMARPAFQAYKAGRAKEGAR